MEHNWLTGPRRYNFYELEIDNRDVDTTELVFPNGDRLILLRRDCLEIIRNMDENTEGGDN